MDIPATSGTPRPRPPAPPPRATVPGPLEVFRVLRGSAIEGLAVDHFEQLMVFTKTLLGPVLVVSSPTALRQVLVTNARNYPRDPLQRRMLSDGLGFGLLAAEGDQWRNQRRIVAPHFTPEKVAAFEGEVADVAAKLVQRWEALGEGATVRLDHDIPNLAVDMIDSTLFPDGLGEKATLLTALKHYFHKAGQVSFLDALNLPERVPRVAAIKARRSIAALRSMAEQTVARWRNRAHHSAAQNGILDKITAPAEAPLRALQDVEIRDIVASLATAGSETTAGALCWALYLLSVDADWRLRVEAEADREMPDGVYVPGSQTRLTATRAVVEETLRLYPTVAVTARRAVEADVLDSMAVKAGTIIVVSPWLIHRHRRLWDKPDLFDPSRFLPDAKERIDRFTYMPFGTGARVCVGQGYAMQEMVITIASIMRRFRLRPAPDFHIFPEQRVTLQPAGDLSMILHLRR